MSEEKFEKAKIVIQIDENGRIIDVKNTDGTDLKYHPDEKKKIHGTGTRLVTPNDCCWRLVNGVWRCLPQYC